MPKYRHARLGEGGGLTLPVSKKCKNKNKKNEEKEEERDKERKLHRHDVWSELPLCFTNGGWDLRTVRTNTSVFGGRGPGRWLEGSVLAKTGKFKRANKSTLTRHLPVLTNAFDIDFSWGLPFSFPMFLEAQVRHVTVTFSRRRAGVFNEGRAASLEKSTGVFQSLPGVKLWLASSPKWKKNSRASSRRGLWHGGGQHVALPARTSDQRRCADVNLGC